MHLVKLEEDWQQLAARDGNAFLGAIVAIGAEAVVLFAIFASIQIVRIGWSWL